ncbi:hypothetical protein [Paenibacillus sp. sgz500958]|uniref:hypothetical protein n=1 Tax=Paenibacillus sp. sgz500958 TaxID=3242475 RepID=UPI0036D30FEE
MAGIHMPIELREALGSLSRLLSFEQEEDPPLWLLGGSCGLLLHGVPLTAEPRDIDLYSDLGEAHVLHGALSGWALDKPAEDWSRGCYSLMSHYRIGAYPVDLVSGFRICCGQSRYTVETNLLLMDAPVQIVENLGCFRLMPLAHEFVFNVLRGRRDRYERIASVMRANKTKHLPLLQSLIKRNSLELEHITQFEDLMETPLLHV